MKAVLNEHDIKMMVKACVRLLTEATRASDVYAKYYSNIIPQELWDKLVEGTEIITPFHTAVANFMVSYLKQHIQFENNQQVQKAVKELFVVAEKANEAWQKGNVARQFLNNTAKEKHYVYTGKRMLTDFLDKIISGSAFSEQECENLGGGLVKVYEDEKLLVTCTLSYTASHKNYSHTHWCTASGIDGEWSGYDMFVDYTEDDKILVQFVDKNNKSNCFQMATDGYLNENGYLDYSDLMDMYDNTADYWTLSDIFGKQSVLNACCEISRQFATLCDETQTCSASEYNYYRFKTYQFVTHNAPQIIEKMNSQAYVDSMLSELTSCIRDCDSILDLCSNNDYFEGESFTFETLTIKETNEGKFIFIQGRPNFQSETENTFFSRNELGVMRRSFNLPGGMFPDLKGHRLFIFGEYGEFIGSYKSSFLGKVYGIVADLVSWQGQDSEHTFVNLNDGKIIFSYVYKNSKESLSLLSEQIKINNEVFNPNKNQMFFLGKEESSTRFKLLFIIYGDGKIERVNKTLVAKFEPWMFTPIWEEENEYEVR